jgi:hypothetical protein
MWQVTCRKAVGTVKAMFIRFIDDALSTTAPRALLCLVLVVQMVSCGDRSVANSTTYKTSEDAVDVSVSTSTDVVDSLEVVDCQVDEADVVFRAFDGHASEIDGPKDADIDDQADGGTSDQCDNVTMFPASSSWICPDFCYNTLPPVGECERMYCTCGPDAGCGTGAVPDHTLCGAELERICVKGKCSQP